MEDVLRIVGSESTLANLRNDHEFISKEYISIDMRPFGKPKAKPRELMLKVDNIISSWTFVVSNEMYNMDLVSPLLCI